MVLYFFPPVGGISTSRNVRNVEHLPHHGWTPVVLTPQNAAYELKDPSTLDLIPTEARVIRTPSLEAGHVRPLVVGLLRVMSDRRPLRFRSTSLQSLDAPNRPALPRSPEFGNPAGTRVRERLRRIVFFPDDQVGWLPFALVAALRSHRATPFDAVYSTSSPVTSHVVAGILKRLTGLPWVAEFRDPWLGSALGAPLPWLHRRLQTKLERWIIRSADRVVFVAPSTTHLYQRRYPHALEFVTIPNGYDRSETVARSTAPRSRRFRIVYTGTLNRPVELQTFLDGVDALLARRPGLSEQLEIVFYGAVAEACREITRRLADNGRLSGVVQFRGFVPRRVALEALAEADAALVLLGAGPGMDVFIPGKVFDYLGQSRQILAMIPPGDARDVLEELGWGVIAEPNPADVERAVERLLTLPTPDGPADPDGKYDRVALAGRLATCLRDAAEAAQHARSAGQGR
jgi:glycosyltransferase involved in cell wall biosynthesis